MKGNLERGIQTPMAHGRSTKIISIIKWIRTSRLSIKNSLLNVAVLVEAVVELVVEILIVITRFLVSDSRF